jgi:hypothetical protein
MSGATGLLLAALCSFAQSTKPAASRNDPTPTNAPRSTEYMRVLRPDAGTVQLQIALKKFAPARGSGPAVWLAAASHLGETNYYAALQRHLDGQGLVLFEAVKDSPSRNGPKQGGTGPAGNATNDGLEATAEWEEASLQSTLARSLGLLFQLRAIDYSRPHFRNSDLSVPEIQKLLSANMPGDGPGDPAGAEGSFATLLQIMDGTTFLGAIAHFGVRILGTNPKLQGLAKLTLIETIGQLEGDLSQIKGLPPEWQKLLQVLIQSRNQAVLRDLKRELARPKPPKSVSILYGAAHMADLEQRLRTDLGYQPAEETWLTAISVNTEQAGLTEAEREMVRSLVKWQFEQLQGRKGK